MGRSFIQLYVLLVLTITLFIISLKTLPEILLDDILAEHRTKTSSGTYFLVKQELANVPESQWQNKIAELRPHFGYQIKIQNISDISLTQKQLHRLYSGMIAITKDQFNHSEILHSQLLQTEKVLSIAFAETGLEHFERSARGPFYIGFKRLNELDQKQWPQEVKNLAMQFGYPISLIKLEALTLKKEYVEILRNGGTYAINLNDNGETFYKRIPNSDFVIKAGPIHVSTIIVDLLYYAMAFLALMIAVALYIWMRPISRDLTELSNVAFSFGKGQFKARLKICKNSAIYRVAETFNGMADRIKNLIDSHKELTNAVSHELRTPISRLRFGIEMLKKSKDPSNSQKYIDSMNTDIDELDSLVSELLTYALFDREKPELNLESVDFNSWIEQLTRHHQIGLNDVQLKLANNSELFDKKIIIDTKLVFRAISNLISNAVRYADQHIQISTTLNPNGLTISVEDDGPGVAFEDREKILEPFKRLDFSRDRRSGGCGLGLSIVKQIAQWHDGKITISNSSLGGAKFNFQCPQTR